MDPSSARQALAGLGDKAHASEYRILADEHSRPYRALDATLMTPAWRPSGNVRAWRRTSGKRVIPLVEFEGDLDTSLHQPSPASRTPSIWLRQTEMDVILVHSVGEGAIADEIGPRLADFGCLFGQ